MSHNQSTDGHALDRASPDLVAVLESAARLQVLVPDATLVGGSAAEQIAEDDRGQP